MPKLEHRSACSDCPFRRDSRPGWLGAETDPTAFTIGALCDEDEHPLPCHLAIDYEDPEWRETQYPDAPLCAGALVMCRNNRKVPRDAERAALVAQVEPSDGVFRTEDEFVAHHERGRMARNLPSDLRKEVREALASGSEAWHTQALEKVAAHFKIRGGVA